MSTPDESQDVNQEQQSMQETDPDPTYNFTAEENKPDELQILKSRARMMGITFSNNIGVEALKAKINDVMEGAVAPKVAASVEVNPLAPKAEGKKKSLLQTMRDEQLRLIRVRITNMDPKKKELPGEVFTVGNEVLGMIKKFVPYGEATENGYHIPYIMFKALRDRKFLNIRTIKDRKTGHERVEHVWAREFALEVLPPLTSEELKELAKAQIAAGTAQIGQE